MTREQIDSVLERVRSWPQEDQEELADLVREIEARRTGIYILNDEEREAIAKAPAIASVALRFLPDAGHADVSCKLQKSGLSAVGTAGFLPEDLGFSAQTNSAPPGPRPSRIGGRP